jgi:hypothetical protein
MNYKALHKKRKTEQREPQLKYGGEIRWYERVSKSVPTSDIRRGILAKDLATFGPIPPNSISRLRDPTLDLSTLGCSSTHNNTLYVLQHWTLHLLRPP